MGQTDRQTDHATKKCVGIARIACTATVITSNKSDSVIKSYTVFVLVRV